MDMERKFDNTPLAFEVVLCVCCEAEVPMLDADACAECGEWACAECQDIEEGKLLCLYCAEDYRLAYQNSLH